MSPENEDSTKGTADFDELSRIISTEKKAVSEINSSITYFENTKDSDEKQIIKRHLRELESSFRKTNEKLLEELEKINMTQPLSARKTEEPEPKVALKQKPQKIPADKKFLKELSGLEKETIKRIRKRGKKVPSIEVEKPSKYAEVANRYFSKYSKKLSKEKSFETMRKDLMKTNLEFTPVTYISVSLLTTCISAVIGFIIFLFFLFVKVGGESMISLATGNFGMRLLKTFWIIFAVPAGTFLFTFFYPSLEKKSAENKINQELPFAAIHMAAISESMLEPSKIFSIIIQTKEYPYTSREFTKLINEINVYGYDLVNALRSTASNTPSTKLAELLNSLATTINSGGNLTDFFDKRSQSLLFEHRLEREKSTKIAETFMDIYISVVIAAPMILMLLLMMMKISGLGLSIGTSSITIIMVLAVSLINVGFLSFLQLRKPTG